MGRGGVLATKNPALGCLVFGDRRMRQRRRCVGTAVAMLGGGFVYVLGRCLVSEDYKLLPCSAASLQLGR